MKKRKRRHHEAPPVDPEAFAIEIAPGLVARSSGPVNRVQSVEDYGPLAPRLTTLETKEVFLTSHKPTNLTMDDPYEQPRISDTTKPALTLAQLRRYHQADGRIDSMGEIVDDVRVIKPNVSLFWYWMNERHRIWKYRQEVSREGFPWTRDPILGVYRFCNVFRELDTVTIWIRKHWREPYAGHPNMWLAMAVARLINWPDTLDAIGFPDWDMVDVKHRLSDTDRFKAYADKAVRWMNKEIAKGRKVYTGAYMLRGDIQSEAVTNDKPSYTFRILEGLWENRGAWTYPFVRLEAAWAWFANHPGMGPFLSYEAVTDLRWTNILAEAPDIYKWACAGPGAIRGLNRLAGRFLTAQPPAEVLVAEMKALMLIANKMDFTHKDDYITPLHPDLFSWRYDSGHSPRPELTPIEMRDIEHSLCEFDKYMRVLEGTGRPRAKYTP